MGLSVIMTVCLLAVDGTTICNVTGNSKYATYESEDECTESANSSINDALLESGKEGWASGVCVGRSAYVSVVKKSVSQLESEGYKVKFKAFKGAK